MKELLIYTEKNELLAEIRIIVAEEIQKLLSKPEVKAPKYGTRLEISKFLRVSFPTLNRFERDKILIPCKIGGRVLYKWDDVYKTVEQGNNPKYRRE